MDTTLSSQAMIEQKLAADQPHKHAFSDLEVKQLITDLATKYQSHESKLDIYESMAKYGIQDVSTFLKSPQGKIIVAVLEKKKAELDALEENLHNQAEHQRLSHLIALVLLSLTHRHKNDNLEKAQQEADEYIQHQKELNEQTAKQHRETSTMPMEFLYDMDHATSTLYLERIEELKQLEEITEQLLLEEQEINLRHQTLNDVLDETHGFLDTATPDEIASRIQEIKNQIELDNSQFTKEVEDDSQTMSDPKQQLYPVGEQANLFQPQYVLQNRMHLQLQVQSMQDHLKVLKNKKAYYTIAGEPTSSPRDAAYIVPKGFQMVKDHNNRVNLVGANTNQSGFDSHEKRNVSPGFTVKHSTLLQHTAEKENFSARLTSNLAQKDQVKQQVAVLAPTTEQLKKDIQLQQQQQKKVISDNALNSTLTPKPTLSSPKMAPPACTATNQSIPTLSTAATVTANKGNQEVNQLKADNLQQENLPSWPPKPSPYNQ